MLGCVRRLGQALLPQFLFEHLAHESDAGEVLAQSIVEILPDAPLFPAADFEDRAFEAFGIGNVDSSEDHIFQWRRSRRPEHRARPGNHPRARPAGWPTRSRKQPEAVRRAAVRRSRGSGRSLRAPPAGPRRSLPITSFEAYPVVCSHARLKRTIRPSRVEDQDQGANSVEHRRSEVAFFLKRFLGALEVRDIEADSVNEPGAAIAAPDHPRVTVKRDRVAIASDHPIDRTQRLSRIGTSRRLRYSSGICRRDGSSHTSEPDLPAIPPARIPT